MSLALNPATIDALEIATLAERSGDRWRLALDVALGEFVRSVGRWVTMTEQQLDQRLANSSSQVRSMSSSSAHPDTEDDRQLITRVIAGDRDAFAVLYDRHSRAVFGLLLRVVGDRPVAEELVQETFLRVWQHAPSFDGGRGAPLPWMLGIAHHLGLNEHRRRRHRPVVSPATTDEIVDPRIANLASNEPDPADQALRHEQLSTVAAALGALPAVQRDVIRLYAVGHTQEEIANKLDAPLGTVKTRMRRGLLRLRDALAEHGTMA